MNSLVSALSSF